METDVHTQQSYGWYFIGAYHIYIHKHPLETLVFGADRFGVPFRREDRMRSYLIQEGRWFRTLVAGSRCQHPGAQYLPLNPYILCVFMCTLKKKFWKKLHNYKECVQMTDI